MDWFPKHSCGLYLSHNEHKDVYEEPENFYDFEDFTSQEEFTKALSEDSIWSLQWYPDTPIGFHRICASSLEAIKKELKDKYEQSK